MSIQENNDYYIKQANLIATMFTAGIIDVDEYHYRMALISDECFSDRD